MYYESPGASSGWSRPYIFIAGVVTGIVLGWIFQGVIGTLVRMGMVLLVVVVCLYVFNLWRKSQKPSSSAEDITDADWRDLNSRRRP